MSALLMLSTQSHTKDISPGDDSQANLIHTIAQFMAGKVVPLVMIFSSRPETQHKMTFNSLSIDSILQRMPLGDDYRADDDIRLFLGDYFTAIKSTHPLRSSIDGE